MNPYKVVVPILIAILSSLSVCVSARAAGSTTLSASAIVARCQKAYDALHGYSCHTEVNATGNGGSTYHATADISFARPGHIYAAGTTMMGAPYAYYSDGSKTQQYMLGSWQPVKDPGQAIAGATGIAQSAATTIPALLLHTQWGNPFGPGATVSPAVQTQSVNGRPCYFIQAKGIMKESFWIDKKTFLLDQVATNISMGNISLRQLQTITKQRSNPSIPASVFSAHLAH